MAKKKQIEELLEDDSSQDVATGSDQSYREMYEEMFNEWLVSDVVFHQVTNPFRIKSVAEGARKAVEYFIRASELGKPLVLSGVLLAMKLNSHSALENYKTYHPEFESLVGAIKDVCEQYAEEMLYTKVSSGAKFVLMNRNKWSNREIQEVTNHNIDVTIGNAGSQL